MLPQLSIFDPFVKGSIGALLIPSSFPDELILYSSLIVWMLNVAVPGLYGSLLWIFTGLRSPSGK